MRGETAETIFRNYLKSQRFLRESQRSPRCGFCILFRHHLESFLSIELSFS